MACQLVSATSLSEPMLENCSLGLLGININEISIKIHMLSFTKCIWKCCRENGCHFDFCLNVLKMCCVLICCPYDNNAPWIHMLYMSIFFRITSLALGQSYDCPIASEVTPKEYGSSLPLPIQNKTQQSINYVQFGAPPPAVLLHIETGPK